MTEDAVSAADGRAWEISSYQEGDKEGILALIRDEYGDTDLADGDYFDWLRAACPPDIHQWLVREKATGRVISAGTSVAARAVWQGREIGALLGFNIVVAPEYRRQGIHTALTKQTREDVKKAGYCLTTVFPNPKSMPQLARSDNFHLVSQVPLLVRPLDMRTLMQERVGNPLLVWGGTLGWAVAGRTLWREQRQPHDGQPMQISADTVLDGGYDRFWSEVRTKYDLMLVRDRAFLQWRFCDIPTRSYQLLSARQADRILGYIVLYQANIRGIMSGIIADFMVLPGALGDRAGSYLLAATLQQFKKAQVPLTGGLMLPHTQEYALMRRAGYLNAPRPFAPQPFHLFIRRHCDDLPLGAITRPESWYVSVADHDAA
jgi:GNAT superfamily N-acetyltransferase